MGDEVKVYIHGKQDIAAGYIKGYDGTPACAYVVPCKFCIHKGKYEGEIDGSQSRRIIWPSQDWECPFRCDDDYYDKLPPDDFFCGNGACTINTIDVRTDGTETKIQP